MFNGNGDVAAILSKAGVSSASIETATTILSRIFVEPDLSERKLDVAKEWKRRRDDVAKQGVLETMTLPSGTWVKGINFIPSDMKGSCTDLLVVAYIGRAELEKFSMEAIVTCIACYKKIKAVLLVGDMWDDAVFSKSRRPAFEALHHSFGICLISQILVGGQWSVTPIII